MPTLLRIDVSPRGPYSVSHNLADAAVTAWQAANPEGKLITRDLSQNPLPYVDLPWITGAYSTPDQHTPEAAAAIKVSDELIAELLSADRILIASPMYNFNVPAALKAWIDHIVRLGKTFGSDYSGLAGGRSVSAIMASGSNFGSGSHYEAYDFFSKYLPAVFGFIGITDVSIYKAGDTASIAQGKITLEDYLAQHGPGATALLVK